MWTLQGISPVTTLLLCNISENFFLTNTSLNIHMIWVPFHCIVINWYQWDHCVYVKKVMWQKSLDYWPHGLSWMCIVQYHTYMFSTIKGLSSIRFQNIQDDFFDSWEEGAKKHTGMGQIYYVLFCFMLNSKSSEFQYKPLNFIVYTALSKQSKSFIAITYQLSLAAPFVRKQQNP